MHRLAPQSLGITLFVATGVATAALMRGDGRVEELMERTHEGRRSPYRQVQAQAAAAQPAWTTVDAALPRFYAMARVLLASPNADIKDSADDYVDAVKALGTASKQRDAKALQEAIKALEQSCGDCHFKGGVGGELEDHEDRDEDRR